MVTNRELIDRFFRYVKIDTQSAEDTGTQPSTAKQHDLASLLYRELCEMGVDAEYDKKHCYVYAKLPGQEPALGFIAHMDTSPAASGKDVKPRIEGNYRGRNIVLRRGNAGTDSVIMRTDDFPELLCHVGEDLIVTDGSTLLGADDKAVGSGTDHFDTKRFGAEEAYTVDGGKLGEIEYECFNAAAARVEIKGRSVHTGDAKNAMLNALMVGMEFHSLLPAAERPEHTEGYEGFYHLGKMEGCVDHACLRYIIRDHDYDKFQARKAFMTEAAEFINEKYRAFAGSDVIRITLRDQYYNMAIPLKDHMELITRAQNAMQELGIEPIILPIRGGTDGAKLTYMGIPCPNLCDGGYNFHGRYEYASVQEMEKSAELLILLAKP